MEEKNGLQFSKFDANCNPQIQEAQDSPSRRNMNYTKHIIIKLLKTNDKKKILKVAKGEKKRHYILRNNNKNDRILTENNANQKTMYQQAYLKY